MIKKVLQKVKKKLVIEHIISKETPVLEGEFLKNKVAFIFGASGGIGKAIAERYVANGCQVILAGRNELKLKLMCQKLGNNSKYILIDSVDFSSFKDVINRADNFFEEKRHIDILVNCAGIHGPSNFWDVTPSDWDAVMNINLKSMFFLTQEFGRYMIDNDIHGHILNISSASALKPGKTPYEISKNAVKAMTLGMSAELIKYGIVVNCLAPGPTATEMIHRADGNLEWEANPTGRVATPNEIANWAVLMVSSMGDYVIGDSFYITGGSGTIVIDK